MKIFNTSSKEISKEMAASGKRVGIMTISCMLFLFLAGLLSPAESLAQYSSSTAVQDTFGTFPGMIRTIILDVQVNTSGSASQVTSMTFNTGGTTTASNILNAKL